MPRKMALPRDSKSEIERKLVALEVYVASLRKVFNDDATVTELNVINHKVITSAIALHKLIDDEFEAMGEVADDIINGDRCQLCGVPIFEENETGALRTCEECDDDD